MRKNGHERKSEAQFQVRSAIISGRNTQTPHTPHTYSTPHTHRSLPTSSWPQFKYLLNGCTVLFLKTLIIALHTLRFVSVLLPQALCLLHTHLQEQKIAVISKVDLWDLSGQRKER